jgi:hypothetical protein
MRGNRNDQPMMLAWIDIEARVPLGHPLRPIKKLADDALRELSDTFDRMYAQGGAAPSRRSACSRRRS